MAANAYAPYSKYAVGAVVRMNGGREFEGVNVENAAYPLGQCAEKTAIGAAAVAGFRPGDIAAVGISWISPGLGWWFPGSLHGGGKSYSTLGGRIDDLPTG